MLVFISAGYVQPANQHIYTKWYTDIYQNMDWNVKQDS